MTCKQCHSTNQNTATISFFVGLIFGCLCAAIFAYLFSQKDTKKIILSVKKKILSYFNSFLSEKDLPLLDLEEELVAPQPKKKTTPPLKPKKFKRPSAK